MNNRELQNAREEYKQDQLLLEETDSNPVVQFERWFEQYRRVAERDYNAMVLSTATKDGKPSSRVVLLKGLQEGGFVFYTNYDSEKGRALGENPFAALNFYWPELERQVRVEGRVERLPAELSDHYFNSRPKASQIGAIVSPQSQRIPSRAQLEDRLQQLEQGPEEAIVRPEHWGGYRVIPERFEFWQGRKSRLHDRIEYVVEGQEWKRYRLAP